MMLKTVFGGAVAILLSTAPVWAQSITPMSDWVPNIDRTAAAIRAHQIAESRAHGATGDVTRAGDASAGR